jgi:hypothetical protein
MCDEPCHRVPQEGDCGQEYTKPEGNEGHFLGCGYYRYSTHDDAGQYEIYIHSLETGEIVYFEEADRTGSDRTISITQVGCEPACEDWEVIPCPTPPMGGSAGQ